MSRKSTSESDAQFVEARILSPMESLQASVDMARDGIEGFYERLAKACVEDDAGKRARGGES